LLTAPRRVGKTSFSKKLIERAKENGWKTLYLDLEGLRTESEFVKFFKDRIKEEKWWSKAGDAFFNIFEGIKIQENGISINTDVWRNDTYGKIAKLIGEADQILIVIDELTVFLNELLKQENGRENVELFLEWLRKCRQETKASWIFCSSVGIENFASMHQLSKHINDIHSFPIGAFSEHEAKDFILRLNVDENIKFTDEHIKYILDKLVWHLPFFIQLWVEKINFLVCVENKPFSKETIDEAYNRLTTESHFNTWDERLKVYAELEGSARKVLKLCVPPDGISRSDLLINLSDGKSEKEEAEKILSQVLVMLMNDGYLTENKGKYIFRSPLLRDFWHGRFIK
jgi:hypothetical protein